jgi:hypothetical protein
VLPTAAGKVLAHRLAPTQMLLAETVGIVAAAVQMLVVIGWWVAVMAFDAM